MEYQSHRDIINKWPAAEPYRPGLASFAFDLKENPMTARGWRQRRQIPSEHWDRVVSAAARRHIAISIEDLVRTQRRRPRRRRALRQPSEARA